MDIDVRKNLSEEVRIMYRIKEQQPYMDRKWLYGRYVNEKYNPVDIAEECGVSEMTIHRWLRRLNIPIRERGESITIGSKRKFPGWDKEWQKEFKERVRVAEERRLKKLLEELNNT